MICINTYTDTLIDKHDRRPITTPEQSFIIINHQSSEMLWILCWLTRQSHGHPSHPNGRHDEDDDDDDENGVADDEDVDDDNDDARVLLPSLLLPCLHSSL